MFKIYLVDFENVHDEGLLAISSNICKNDMTYVFFTSNAKKVDFTSLIKLVNDDKLRIIEADPGSQSLDLSLASYLGYLISQNAKNETEYVIVSNDKDYAHIINLWTKQGYTISAKKLKKSSTQSSKEKKEVQQKGKKLSADEKTELNNKISQALASGKIDAGLIGKATKFVLKCVSSGQGKNYIYNNMRKEFGNDVGHELYNLIKKLF